MIVGRIILTFLFSACLSPSASRAEDNLPCYNEDSSMPSRKQVVRCDRGDGTRDYYLIQFKPAPEQCKVKTCGRQVVQRNQKPEEKKYISAPARDCARALTKPGFFVEGK